MITENLRKLIADYQEIKKLEENAKKKPDTMTIHVDEFASKIAAIYENIRRVIDWREELLMRRIAIKRILKRRKVINQSVDAEDFISELIRGGHFSNDTIERSKVKEIKRIIEKYLYIISKADSIIQRNKSIFWNDVLEIASCEIEEAIDKISHLKMNSLVEFMERAIKDKIVLGRKAAQQYPLSTEDKNDMVYIAIQQALFNLDESIIAYNLLKRKNPHWQNIEKEKYDQCLNDLFFILNKIKKSLSSPIFNKIYNICERYDTPYLIISDIASEKPIEAENIFSNEKLLMPEIRKKYENRLDKLRSKINRAAVYSTLSIFLTKVLLIYALELPIAIYVSGELNVIAQILNVAIPTSMMLFLVTTIKMPSENNFKLVIEEVKRIISDEQKKLYEAEVYQTKGKTLKILSATMYFLSFCFCYLFYFFFLYKLEFPPLSWVIFIIFTSLVLFMGIKIRRRARELHVEEKKEGFFGAISDLFVIPVIRVGRWFSGHWRKFNIISIMFDFLIEMPFLGFVKFIENWRYFLKEKKEDIH